MGPFLSLGSAPLATVTRGLKSLFPPDFPVVALFAALLVVFDLEEGSSDFEGAFCP